MLNIPTDYFTKLLEDDLKAVVKPQYVDQIPRAIRTPDKSVKALLEGRASLENLDEVIDTLGTFAPFSDQVRFKSANTRQSYATFMTVMLHCSLVVSYSVSPSVLYVCRMPTCKFSIFYLFAEPR